MTINETQTERCLWICALAVLYLPLRVPGKLNPAPLCALARKAHFRSGQQLIQRSSWPKRREQMTVGAQVCTGRLHHHPQDSENIAEGAAERC